MKKRSLWLAASLLILVLSGCGINATMLSNLNTTQTVVELGEDNYKIIERVEGSASDTYLFLIGGFRTKNLYNQAMADLMSKADLSGSRALVNVVTEQHIESYIVYAKVSITTSAHIVEFTD